MLATPPVASLLITLVAPACECVAVTISFNRGLREQLLAPANAGRERRQGERTLCLHVR